MVTNYPAHKALSQAEFDRAWLNHQAGNSAKAFQLFTNYIERFRPTTSRRWRKSGLPTFIFSLANSPRRSRSIVDFLKTQTFSNSPATCHGRLAWGRSAFFRQNHARPRRC